MTMLNVDSHHLPLAPPHLRKTLSPRVLYDNTAVHADELAHKIGHMRMNLCAPKNALEYETISSAATYCTCVYFASQANRI